MITSDVKDQIVVQRDQAPVNSLERLIFDALLSRLQNPENWRLEFQTRAVIGDLRLIQECMIEVARDLDRRYLPLVLATARILRAHLQDSLSGEHGRWTSDTANDVADMDNALAPFGPGDAPSVNEESATRRGAEWSEEIPPLNSEWSEEISPMNDAQKAQTIGRLMAAVVDEPLSFAALAGIAEVLWPQSRANHDPFIKAYASAETST